MDYICTFEGTSNGNDDFIMAVKAPPPASAPAPRKSPSTAYNQRCRNNRKVAPRACSGSNLVKIMESAASAPVYAVIKRPDEKFVTEQAFENPKFVEDIVRDLAVAAEQRRPHPGIRSKARTSNRSITTTPTQDRARQTRPNNPALFSRPARRAAVIRADHRLNRQRSEMPAAAQQAWRQRFHRHPVFPAAAAEASAPAERIYKQAAAVEGNNLQLGNRGFQTSRVFEKQPRRRRGCLQKAPLPHLTETDLRPRKSPPMEPPARMRQLKHHARPAKYTAPSSQSRPPAAARPLRHHKNHAAGYGIWCSTSCITIFSTLASENGSAIASTARSQ